MSKHLLFFLLFVTKTIFCQVNELWNTRYNGTGNGIDQPVDLVIDALGNSYVTGITNNGADFDVITIKYNNTGALEWTNVYGGTGLDEPRAMAIDNSGDIIIVGSRFITSGDWDIFTLKINGATGVQSWAQLNAGSNFFDLGNDVAIDASNNIYVAGTYYQSATNLDYTLLKYNSSGAFQWDNSGGTVNKVDEGLFVNIDNSGNAILGGTAEFSTSTTFFDFRIMKINSTGTTLWSLTEDSGFGNLDKPRAMTLDATGNIYIGGDGFTSSVNLGDMLLMKVLSAGTLDWKKLYTGNNQATDHISAIAVDPATNNVFVTGKVKYINTAEDFHTRAYNNSGVLLWSNTFSSAGNNFDEATDITLKNNFLYVTGYSFITGENNNYNTIKYDLLGNEKWRKTFNYSSNQSDKAYKINLDNQDNVFVTGSSYTNGTQDLDIATIKYCQLETIATNDTSVCIGSSIGLTANAPSGFNYIWTVVSGTPSSTSTISCTSCQSPTVTPDMTTTYAVSAENSVGCIDYDTVVVTVNEAVKPIITSVSGFSFCIGDSIVLSVLNQNYDSYTWNNGGTNFEKTILNAGQQIVTVLDSNNCENSDTITTQHFSLPSVNAGNDTSTCTGVNLQLQATGATSYLWDANATLSQFIISNPIASPSSSQVYSVTGTDNNGCKNSDDITVTVNLSPSITASGGGLICAGDTLQLNASGGNVYSWNNANTLDDANIASPKAFPIQTTTYTVTGTDLNNCHGQAMVLITTNSLPFISAGVDQTICSGDSVNLFATGGSSYSWNASPSLSATNISNPWASPAATSNYIVEATDANNCMNSDTVSVIVNSAPNINAGIDTALCLFNNISLLATGAVSYTWNPSPSLTGINLAAPTVQPVTPTTYTVTGTNSNGCSASDDVFVNIYALPTIDAGSNLEICINDSVQLNPTGGISYVWNFDPTLSQLNIANPYAKPAINTVYFVTGTDIHGCENTSNVLIEVNSLPIIFAGNNQFVCENENAQLQASGGTSYIWDNTPSLSNLNIFNPQTNPLQTSEWFYVTGIDNNNCKNKDSVKVTVNPLPLAPVLSDTFPNIISSYVFGNNWYFNGNIIPQEVNDTINYVNQGNLGTYTATHTDFNGCTSIESSGILIEKLVYDLSISKTNQSVIALSAYPNPVTNILTIEVNTNIDDIDNLLITDISGKIIYSINDLIGAQHQIDFESFESGIYILTVFADHQARSIKIVK
ncbi:MAG: T9SS type A sorting domain-containing protein [Crocinitomicaceae bacterium]